VFVSAPWNDAEGRARAIAWVDDVGAALRPHGRGVYVNNLTDAEAGRVPEAYGGNYERLVALKRKYDPENLFQHNANIPPG
jgi:FAD/FMN-containing dehydrogenase